MDWAEIRSRDDVSLRQGITEYFREAIHAGRMRPGDQLPSSHVIAKELATGLGNVQRALSTLAREGLITRLPKRGSVVTERKALETVALYRFFDPRYPPRVFQRLLLEFLEEEAGRHNLKARVYFDNQRPFSLAPLLAAYRRREFDAVIFLERTHQSAGAIDWTLPGFPATALVVSHSNVHFDRSIYDETGLAECAVEALRRTGRRNVGVISTMSLPRPGEKTTSAVLARRYHRTFADALDRAGLSLAPEHAVYTPDGYLTPSPEAYEQFAYRHLKRMWSLPRRPEALFLFPDESFPGLLAALYELGIRVPQDLALVVHHNRENPLLVPLECWYVEKSVRQLASATMELLLARHHGRESKQRVDYEIVRHPGVALPEP